MVKQAKGLGKWEMLWEITRCRLSCSHNL